MLNLPVYYMNNSLIISLTNYNVNSSSTVDSSGLLKLKPFPDNNKKLMNPPLHQFQDQLKRPTSPPVFDYLTTVKQGKQCK